MGVAISSGAWPPPTTNGGDWLANWIAIALGGICLPRMCHLVNKFISLAVLRPELSRKSNTTWPVGRVSIRLQLGGQLLKAPGEIER